MLITLNGGTCKSYVGIRHPDRAQHKVSYLSGQNCEVWIVHLSTHPFMRSSIYLPFQPFVHPVSHPFIKHLTLSIHLSTLKFPIYQPVYPPIMYLSIYMFIHLFIHPLIYPTFIYTY